MTGPYSGCLAKMPWQRRQPSQVRPGRPRRQASAPTSPPQSPTASRPQAPRPPARHRLPWPVPQPCFSVPPPSMALRLRRTPWRWPHPAPRPMPWPPRRRRLPWRPRGRSSRPQHLPRGPKSLQPVSISKPPLRSLGCVREAPKAEPLGGLLQAGHRLYRRMLARPQPQIIYWPLYK